MRALLTGGAGFIGTRLSHALAARGYSLTVLDIMHPQVHAPGSKPDLPRGTHFLHSDVTDPAAMTEAVADGHDLVVHLAAETGTGQSLDEAARHAHVNVTGTAQLLDALSQRGRLPSHIVLPSSRAVYGEGEWRERAHGAQPRVGAPRTPEDLAAGHWNPHNVGDDATPVPSAAHRTAPAPTNIYAATKLAQEHLLLAWCIAREVPLSILRLQNVYGPGQSPGNTYTGVMTLFARLAQAGDPVPVYEDGAIVRDFVHVDDVIAALVATCTDPPSGTLTVDIGSGQPTMLLHMAEIVTAAAGAAPPFVTGQYRLGDVRAACCEILAAEQELDWRPQITLEEGVPDVLAWLATHA